MHKSSVVDTVWHCWCGN